jgi:hypothetical protein
MTEDVKPDADVLRLYHGMATVDLSLLRRTFVLDREAGYTPRTRDFCDARITAIDKVLRERLASEAPPTPAPRRADPPVVVPVAELDAPMDEPRVEAAVPVVTPVVAPPAAPLARPRHNPPMPPRTITAHAPRPLRHVVPHDGPRRVVTYDGVEFEVAYDGVNDREVQDQRP